MKRNAREDERGALFIAEILVAKSKCQFFLFNELDIGKQAKRERACEGGIT